jgi:uncharacterized protein (TIGR03663 family)
MARSEQATRRKPRFRERNAVKQVERAPAPPQSPPPPPAPRRKPPERKVRVVPRLSVEQALYLGILAVGFALRIWDVGSRAMHGDEAVHAWMAWRLFTGQGYQYDPVYHGPLQFPVTAVFFFLFGDSETSGRLMSVLFGTALIGLPFFLRREMGRIAALIAAFLIAVSPEFVYDSRLERDDSFTVLFAMVLAIAIFGYLRTRRLRFVYLGAAAAALSLAAMENTYITYFMFGSFIVLALIGELLARRSRGAQLPTWIGRVNENSTWLLAGLSVLLALALVATMALGIYPPVPVVVAAALIALVLRQALVETHESAEDEPGRFTAALRSIPWVAWLNAFTIIVAILFAFYSTFGTNLNGIWDGPRVLNNGICPGNPFPLNPCRKDIVGGLFYWLSQHRVARGGQPWYYYTFLFSLYEQLVLVFGIAGIVYSLRRPTLFSTFAIYWAVLAFGIYSWAGEKFPWLLVHPLLPFTLLAAMFLARVLSAPRRWMYLGLAVAALLTLLEIHSMYEVNFVNGADPVEMMVYVQSAPDTPKVAASIERLSNQVTGGNTMNVTIDSEETWPFAWYLRNMPNVAYPSGSDLANKPYSTNPVILVDESDNGLMASKLQGKYTSRLYTLRWWFPEDYKDLTWSSFWQDAKDPGYWSVIWQWLLDRRPFGPKGTVNFYYYVKNGLASPY